MGETRSRGTRGMKTRFESRVAPGIEAVCHGGDWTGKESQSEMLQEVAVPRPRSRKPDLLPFDFSIVPDHDPRMSLRRAVLQRITPLPSRTPSPSTTIPPDWPQSPLEESDSHPGEEQQHHIIARAKTPYVVVFLLTERIPPMTTRTHHASLSFYADSQGLNDPQWCRKTMACEHRRAPFPPT